MAKTLDYEELPETIVCLGRVLTKVETQSNGRVQYKADDTGKYAPIATVSLLSGNWLLTAWAYGEVFSVSHEDVEQANAELTKRVRQLRDWQVHLESYFATPTEA